MGKNLFVGNLSSGVTGSDLERVFSECGMVVNAQIVADRHSGQSKGFGFVEMQNDMEARAAIKTMHLKELAGRCMTVSEARPRDNRGRRGGY